jgi:hypothetical protein
MSAPLSKPVGARAQEWQIAADFGLRLRAFQA